MVIAQVTMKPVLANKATSQQLSGFRLKIKKKKKNQLSTVNARMGHK